MDIYGIPIELWNKGREDPVYFARRILGIALHPGQEHFLRNFNKQKFYLLEPSNQWGKSFVVAVALIWSSAYRFNLPGWNKTIKPSGWDQMYYNPIYLTPKLRQARSVYRYIVAILQGQFHWTKETIINMKHSTDYRKRTNYSQLKHYRNKLLFNLDFLEKPKKVPNTQLLSTTPIELKGNRQINILSTLIDQAASTAGDQFPLVMYDECALDNHLQETIGNYLYSRTLKYNAPIVLISTPDQASESYTYFIQLSQDAEGDPDWAHQRGVLTDNIFYSKAEIEKQKEQLKKLDPEVYRQVFYGDHVAGRGTFFRPMEIDRMFVESNEFDGPVKDHTYVIGCDFASSQNYTVFTVLDVTNPERWDLVKLWRFKGNEYSPDFQLESLIDISRDYNNARVGIDASSLAGPLIEMRLHKLEVYSNNFSGINKKELLLALKKAVTWNDEGKIRAPHPGQDKNLQALKREMHTYVEKDRGKVKDCVMALGLAAWVMFMDEKGGDVQSFNMDVFEQEFVKDTIHSNIYGESEYLQPV